MCKHAKQTIKEATWVNYGDVNPIEHNGIWIKKDTEVSGNNYYVVTCDTFDDLPNYYRYGECYIDIDDKNLDWESVKNSCETKDTDTDEIKICDLVYTWGCEQLGGSFQRVEGKRAIRKLINANGIVIHRKEVC